MADDVRITNFPKEKDYYRVAYDLMKDISSYELDYQGKLTAENAREYFMNLYRQCYLVVYAGRTYAEASKETSIPNPHSVFKTI